MRKRIRGVILAVSALLVLTPNTVMAARMEERPLQVQEKAEQAADEGTADNALDMVGDGTETAPYRIKNAKQLRVFADMVNGVNGAPDTGLCAVLTCDIDLSDVCGADIGSWVPIGTSVNPYTGIFDGDSFAIIGLYYHKSNSSYGGLFACNTGEYSRPRKPRFRNFGNRRSGGRKPIDWLDYHVSGIVVLSSP